jgi:hypothetical protein
MDDRAAPGTRRRDGTTVMRKAAAVLAAVPGLGFGLPCVFGIWFFATYGQVWIFVGFPTYGDGPFMSAGIPTTVPLLVAFLVVCVLEVVTAWALWRGRRLGTVLALALLPFELVFWIGFALPFGPPLGLARVALVLANLVRGLPGTTSIRRR